MIGLRANKGFGLMLYPKGPSAHSNQMFPLVLDKIVFT